MLKLYGGALTRAFIVEWYLEELSVPYEFVMMDMNKGAHLKPDFLAINPMGKMPAIEEGSFKLWESGAILLYLCEKYDRLPDSLEERSVIDQWLFFANATLIPGLFVPENCEREAPRLLKPLSQRLQHQDYLLGDRFSIVDVAVGSVLAYIPLLLGMDLSFYPAEIRRSIEHLATIDFNLYPGVACYMQRLETRPAFQKTIGAKKTAAAASV